ncbi:MAG: DUF2764 family protein [Thermodesulfobacteriota bacterium]|nr:DUF2764 family protein [Thermodesulfobacteriota bacterium]
MKQRYYYTINSLPHLSFDRPLPITEKEFLDRTQSELNSKDLDILRTARLRRTEPERVSIHVLKRWYDWERGLRNRLVLLRATKLGVDHKEFIQAGDEDESSVRLADEIFQIESPVDAEHAINKARWDFLEELEQGRYFNLEKLAVYFLKLQILERISLFNEEKGRERLVSILDQVVSVWKQEGKVGFCE